ncbi:hypothetical protein FHT72_006779 [Rhizobium sp. BK077]|uniref:hypothetical protein n=1 Tax=Rhizobium TaxID=379 RepID=UPI00184D2EAD|nr:MULTISPECIES: hypothetical protein [Rhizobium]MBB3302891.1 hypothetical protein [Rhizobium sp. BK112]MBB3372244.1 hypothetical protein [Rhizobium sp. BK077]MBB4182751.1 hypothetical protein [Rhizobium sp. BK109]
MKSILGGALSIACGLLTIFAGSEFYKTLRFSDLVSTAARVESGRPISQKAAQRAAVLAMELEQSHGCREDLVMPAVTVMLRAVDEAAEKPNLSAWVDTLTRADRYMKFALGCSPKEGNYWLRFAMLRRLQGENTAELAALMSLSSKYAPVEPDVLSLRMRVWLSLQPVTRSAGASALASDLVHFLEHAPAQDIKDFSLAADSDMQSRLIDARRK